MLSPVNKVFTILQAPQQSGETPQAFAARWATVECQRDVASGAISQEGSAFTVDLVHGLCCTAGLQHWELMWDDHIILQQFQNGDLRDYRQSLIEDQGVVFQENTAQDTRLHLAAPIGVEIDVKQEDTTGPLESGVHKQRQSLLNGIPPTQPLQPFQRMSCRAECEGVYSAISGMCIILSTCRLISILGMIPRQPTMALPRSRVLTGQTSQRYSMPLQHSHCLVTPGVEEAHEYH